MKRSRKQKHTPPPKPVKPLRDVSNLQEIGTPPPIEWFGHDDLDEKNMSPLKKTKYVSTPPCKKQSPTCPKTVEHKSPLSRLAFQVCSGEPGEYVEGSVTPLHCSPQ